MTRCLVILSSVLWLSAMSTSSQVSFCALCAVSALLHDQMDSVIPLRSSLLSPSPSGFTTSDGCARSGTFLSEDVDYHSERKTLDANGATAQTKVFKVLRGRSKTATISDKKHGATVMEGVSGGTEARVERGLKNCIEEDLQTEIYATEQRRRQKKKNLERFGLKRVAREHRKVSAFERQARAGPRSKSIKTALAKLRYQGKLGHPSFDSTIRFQLPWRRSGTSLLQLNTSHKGSKGEIVIFRVCGSGMYKQDRDISITESATCWQLCNFAHERYYDVCASAFYAASCFRKEIAKSADVPSLYNASCRYHDKLTSCPLFPKTYPLTERCLLGGMQEWNRRSRWSSFARYAPTNCTYTKWTSSEGEIPATWAFTAKQGSQYFEAVQSASFEVFYVIARDVGILSIQSASDILASESAIVPATYWDALSPVEKEDWANAHTFTAPTVQEKFEALTTVEGKNFAATICLFKRALIERRSGYGMLPGTEECKGKIGILRVAALSGVPAAASVDRVSGFDLCVARRWVEVTRVDEGSTVTTSVERQRVVVEGGCAGALSPLASATQLPQMPGDWEQHFLALRYPRVGGTKNGGANCPWTSSVQYGLKCFAFLSASGESYAATFAEAQRACRQAGAEDGLAANYLRLALVQNDNDFNMLSFLSAPDNAAWVGIYQREQTLLARVSPVAEQYRKPEHPCPPEALTAGGVSTRMSALDPVCQAEGASINYPPWESTWRGKDLNLPSAQRWDIPWCSGHPLIKKDDKYVDCAGLEVDAKGKGCIFSAPCEALHDVLCTFPVYYGIPIKNAKESDGAVRLTPRIQCSHKSCVVGFTLASGSGKGMSDASAIWGIPRPAEASVALKVSCVSSSSELVGPYSVKGDVQLHSLKNFKRLQTGVYELCYCSVLQAATNESAACSKAADFRHLLAILIVGDAKEKLKLTNSVRFPSTSHLVSKLAIDTIPEPRRPPAVVDCLSAIEGKNGNRCRFFVKPRKVGARIEKPDTIVLRFVPFRQERSLAENCLQFAEAKISIFVSAVVEVVVPLIHIGTLFYIVCQGSASPLGVLFFQEATVGEKEALNMQATVTSPDIIHPYVSLQIRKKASWSSADAVTVLAVQGDGPDDQECNWRTIENNPTKQTYQVLYAPESDSYTVQVEPGPTYKKTCLKLEEYTTDPGDTIVKVLHLITLPQFSPPLRLEAGGSSCFAVPPGAPCHVMVKADLEETEPEEKAAGKVNSEGTNLGEVKHGEAKLWDTNVTEAEPRNAKFKERKLGKANLGQAQRNPHNLPPFLPTNLRLILLPLENTCPSVPEQAYSTAAGPDPLNPKEVEAAEWIPLTERHATSVNATYALDTAYMPWFAARGTAHVCWLVGEDVECPTAAKCSGSLGALYWVGVSTTQHHLTLCEKNDPSSCVVSVEGFNLSKFLHNKSRLAALEKCGQRKGPGLLRIVDFSGEATSRSNASTAPMARLQQSFLRGGGLAVTAPVVVEISSWPASKSPSDRREARQTSLLAEQVSVQHRGGSSARYAQIRSADKYCRNNATLGEAQLAVNLVDGRLDQNSQSFVAKDDPTEGSQTTLPGSTGQHSVLSFVTDHTLNYSFLELCFQGAQEEKTSLDAYTIRVGFLAFARPLYGAELRVELPQHNKSPVFLVRVVSGGSEDSIFAESSIHLTAPRLPGPTECHCPASSNEATESSIAALRDVRSQGDKKAAYFELPLASHPVAVCWCYGLFSNSSADGVYQNQLVGFYYGGALPKRQWDAPIACSLDQKASTCKVIVKPTFPPNKFSGKTLTDHMPAILSENARLFLLAGLDEKCPESPETWLRQRSGTSALPKGVKIYPTWLPSLKQKFVISDEALTLLQTVGRVSACYTGSYCGAHAGAQNCTQMIGMARWIGPPHETPEQIVICEQLLPQGCHVTVDGHNMNHVDISIPRLALMETCGAGTPLQIAKVYTPAANPSAGGAAPPGDENLPGARPQSNLPIGKSSIGFSLSLRHALKATLCWNPTQSAAFEGGTAALLSTNPVFVVRLGTFILLPLPYPEGWVFGVFVYRPEILLDLPKVDLATMILKVDALIEPSALEHSQGGPPPIGATEDHYVYQALEDDKPCRDADASVWRLSYVSLNTKSRGIFERNYSRAVFLGLLTSSENKSVKEVVDSVLIEYRILPRRQRGKLCWRSLFLKSDGDIIHDYRQRLGSIPAASPAVLSVAAEGGPAVVYCSLDSNPEDCVITLIPANVSGETHAFLPRNSQVLVVRGDVACPVNKEGLPIDNYISRKNVQSLDSTDAVALQADSDRGTAKHATYQFPHADKEWINANGLATICWYYDATGGNVVSKTIVKGVKLGMLSWRGPALHAAPILEECPNNVGCTIIVEGRNLAALDLSQSRVALLHACGQRGGTGLLAVSSYPENYTPRPSEGAEQKNQFETPTEEVEGLFMLLGSHRLDIICKEGEIVAVEHVTWAADRETATPDCAVVNVTEEMRNHCRAKKVCAVYPLILPFAGFPRSAPQADSVELLLKSPCRVAPRRTILSGTYTCEAAPSAFLQTSSQRQTSTLLREDVFSLQAMEFRATPAKPHATHICWNPGSKVILNPAEYTVDLGVLHYVPTAGLTYVRTDIHHRVDSALLEVVVTSLMDEESARSTFVYLKPSQEETCGAADVVDNRIELAGYQRRLTKTAMLSYWMDGPNSPMTLCWSWIRPASVTGIEKEQRWTLGKIPGAVNPKKFDPELALCGGTPAAPCHLKFYPMEISTQYPGLFTTPVKDEEAPPAYAAYQHMAPFFQTHYSIYLSTSPCLEKLLETSATEKAAAAIESNALKLSVIDAEAESINATLKAPEKQWLAKHTRAHVCWSNEGCSFDRQIQLKLCIAEVGIISWLGPLPSSWTDTPVATPCMVDVPCLLEVQGEYLSSMDLRGRVAVLEICGGDAGPGIAKDIYLPGAAESSFVVLATSDTLMQPVQFANSYKRFTIARQKRAVQRFGSKRCGNPRSISRRISESLRGAGAACVGNGKTEHSFLMTHAREVLQVETTLRETRDYAMCWNPREVASGARDEFILHIGTVQFFGFRRTTAFCVSGSTCALTLPISAHKEKKLKVAVKTTDCADLTLTTELGESGPFYVDATGHFHLASRIPAEPSTRLRSFKLCWCLVEPDADCAPADYLRPFGILTVQCYYTCKNIQKTNLVVHFCQSSQTERTPHGSIFLTQHAEGAPDCNTGAPRFNVSFEVHKKQLHFSFRKQTFYTAAGFEGSSTEATICWQSGFIPLSTPSDPKAQVELFFEDAAVVGIVRFAGPEEAPRQNAHINAVWGLPFVVELHVKVLDWMDEQSKDLDRFKHKIPPHWKNVLIALPNQCGSSTVPPVTTLAFKSLKKDGEQRVATYMQATTLRPVAEDVTQLEVCWCTSTTSCIGVEDFSDAVAKMRFYHPQIGLEVACPYDTKCPFKYNSIPREVMRGHVYKLTVKKLGCRKASYELPAAGELQRVESAVSENPPGSSTPTNPSNATASLLLPFLPTSSSESSELVGPAQDMYAFQTVVPETIFRRAARGTEKYLEYSICYCVDKASLCLGADVLNVGRMKIYDVWMGVIQMTLFQTRLLVLPAPFNGVGGLMYGVLGSHVVHCTQVELISKSVVAGRFVLDMSSLAAAEMSALAGDLLYCEKQLAPDCTQQDTPRVRIAKISMKGPSKSNWAAECLLGSQCQVEVAIFNPLTTERLVISRSCASAKNNEYGLSSEGEIHQREDRVKIVKFKWSNVYDLEDVQSQELCWCLAVADADCSDVKHFTLKVGALEIVGLRRGQHRSCNVGTLCRADKLEGFNLRENLFLRIMAAGCGSDGEVLEDLPQEGVFTITDATNEHASFKLAEPLYALAKPPAFFCQCPKLEGPCSTTDEYTWNVGTFTFKGPSGFIENTAGKTTAPLQVTVPEQGGLDPAKDFFILSLAVACQAPEGHQQQKEQSWPVSLGEGGVLSWDSLNLPGNPYYLCYCHQAEATKVDRSPMNFDTTASRGNKACQSVSAYKTWVGIVFVTGPADTKGVYKCKAGSDCTFKQPFVATGTLESADELTEGLLELKKGSCDAGLATLTAQLKAWSYVGDLLVEGSHIPVKRVLITYDVTTTSLPNAGKYPLCWRWPRARGGHSQHLGDLTVMGPIRASNTTSVLSGEPFQFGLWFWEAAEEADLQNVRIRMFFNGAEKPTEVYACKARKIEKLNSPMFRFTETDRDPDAISLDPSSFSHAMWKNLTIVMDATTPEAIAGNWIEVCACDGTMVDCSSAENYVLHVGNIRVAGPYYRKDAVFVPLGQKVDYLLTGIELPSESSLIFLPIARGSEATRCGQANAKHQMPSFQASPPAGVSDKVFFEDLELSWPTNAALICWCGGLQCLQEADYKTEIGTLKTKIPEFYTNFVQPGGRFEVRLRGPNLLETDRISVISSTKDCGAEGSELMDPTQVELPPESIAAHIDILGKARTTTNEQNPDGTTVVLWVSWPLRAKFTADAFPKVCFCSSAQRPCSGRSRFNAFVGAITVLGPSPGKMKITSLADTYQQVHLPGAGLSDSDLLQIVPIQAEAVKTAAAQACNRGRQSSATTVRPESTTADGTQQWYRVWLSPGRRYVLCWSAGVETSAAEEMQSHTERLQVEDNATKSDSSTTSALTRFVEIRQWYFVGDTYVPGVPQGQRLNTVVGVEGTILIKGHTNTTEIYTAYVGHLGKADPRCSSLKKNPYLILSSVAAKTESYLVFKHPPIHEEGSYPACLYNVNATRFFHIGRLRANLYFWKPVVELFGKDRLIMNPCATLHARGKGPEATTHIIWLPDGATAWVAFAHPVDDRSGSPSANLRVPEVRSSRHIDFLALRLRAVVACSSDETNSVYFLGPTALTKVNADLETPSALLIKPANVFKHRFTTPIDVTVKYPFAFLSDYSSHTILALNTVSEEFSWDLFPSEPYLLFAAGLEHIDMDDGRTALFVADMLNHIVGRLDVDVSYMRHTVQRAVIPTNWTAVFGYPRTALQGDRGLSYPFTLAKYEPWGQEWGDQRSLVQTLLLVGELSSSRLLLLSMESNDFQVYGEIDLASRRILTGVESLMGTVLVASRPWSDDSEFLSHLNFFPINQRTERTFFTYPTFPPQLQSGVEYSFLPSVIGPKVFVFKEKVPGSDLGAVGMHLDSKTGEISGVWRGTGSFKVVVAALDLVGGSVWSIEGEAGCQAGDFYDETTSVCQPCPIGTFRDDERELQQCEKLKPNSSTASTGSTLVSQCRCRPGFEMNIHGHCQLCPAGTYKQELSDFRCRGECPANMHSSTEGADSEKALNCNCDRGFYLDKDGCQPCLLGAYCRGELEQPTPCPPFSTTHFTSNKSVEDCLCIAGYTRHDDECVECSHLTYKSFVGNEPCTPCPQPHERSAAGSLLPPSTTPAEIEYTAARGATQLQDCSLCASGFFFDTASGLCSICTKNSYCPGLNLPPIACAENSVTLGEGAETAFSCRCPKGYGRSVEQNPLDYSIICTVCPKNTFQHIEGADSQCLPCPPSTRTDYTQSASLSSCIAVPGYFAMEQLETHLASSGLLQVEGEIDFFAESRNLNIKDMPGFSEIWSRSIKGGDLRRAESKYEVMDQDGLKALLQGCMEGFFEYGVVPPATRVQAHARCVEDCFLQCARNVYCTYMTFYRAKQASLSYVATIANHTGIFVQTYRPCELHIFGKALSPAEMPLMGMSLEKAEGVAVDVSCALKRSASDYLWRQVTYLECPPSAYCPGGVEAQILECTTSALTFAPQAARSEQCACVPGYHPVGLRCAPCPVGTYKSTLSRSACTPCPPTMTTASSGSTGINACACMPGLSAGTAPERSNIRLMSKESESRSCFPCPENMYCPGLWLDPPDNTLHMPPQKCPEGAHVSSSTVNADSLSKCLCLPGYAYTSVSEHDSTIAFECVKCAPGSYKDLQENAPCAGRCMKDAETLEGAVSKKQCFCKDRRYAVVPPEENGTIFCHECIEGAVCPGGFKADVLQAIKADSNFVKITINDHRIPFPNSGFFAVHNLNALTLWNPEAVQGSATFADSLVSEGDKFQDLSTQRVIEAPPASFPQVNGGKRPPQSRVISSEKHALYLWRREGFLTRFNKPVSSLALPLTLYEIATAALLEATAAAEAQRIPEIHPCINDKLCKGGPDNLCEEGAVGFMCAACLESYCVDGFGRSCVRCFPWWVEILLFFVARLVICIIMWLIASVSVLSTYHPVYTHPVLLRMLMSNFFFFSVFGTVPETSKLTIRGWGALYRSTLLRPFVATHPYFKLWCLAGPGGLEVSYTQAWYLQRYFQICMPLIDALLCTVLGAIGLKLYKAVAFRKIQDVTSVLQAVRARRSENILTKEAMRRIECHRCLGLLRFVDASPQDGIIVRLRRLLADLIPAYTVLWIWHYPMFVIECMQLVTCVKTQFKSGNSLLVLSSMPVQKCDTTNPWFLSGCAIGGCALAVGGLGSIVAAMIWASNTADSNPVEARVHHSFLTNGHSVEHRGWEAVVMIRKALLAAFMVIQVHPSSAGAQEVFRNSANLTLSVIYVILLLAFEPYDRRSYNIFTRLEFFGLLCSISSGLIFQGSYYFMAFSYVGPVPLVVIFAFYVYALWSLLVECGRTVIMQPYLARGDTFWSYYHRLTRSIARLSTGQQAKIYYHHITKDLVLEAETKARLIRLHKHPLRQGELLYQKIKYQSRNYFVAALADSVSQVVISWGAFSVPGDWLDFTVRYAFCYCFWQRHSTLTNFRIPHDIEEFDYLRPNMLDYWHETDSTSENLPNTLIGDAAGPCNRAEEDLVQLMLDDDVYDDSPITLMELYMGVQAMRNISQAQLLRLHFWYRERLQAKMDPKIPLLRAENESIERELQEIQGELSLLSHTGEESLASPFVLDFFLTVEMVYQARREVNRLRHRFAKELEEATQARVAQAVARHMALEVQQDSEVQQIIDEVRQQFSAGEEERQRIAYLRKVYKSVPRKRTIELRDKRLPAGGARKKIVVTKFRKETRSLARPTLRSNRAICYDSAQTDASAGFTLEGPAAASTSCLTLKSTRSLQNLPGSQTTITAKQPLSPSVVRCRLVTTTFDERCQIHAKASSGSPMPKRTVPLPSGNADHHKLRTVRRQQGPEMEE